MCNWILGTKIKSVLLYESETWREVKTITTKLPPKKFLIGAYAECKNYIKITNADLVEKTKYISLDQ